MQNEIDIVFSSKFKDSTYSDDASAVPGRMEAIMESVEKQRRYSIVTPLSGEISDIENVHTGSYIESVRNNEKLFGMALLSAGATVQASESGMKGFPAIAIVRPPGHHASRSSAWGYCHFCNMAVALKRLQNQGRINSAFILDFDAHTGDGTIDCLKDWPEVKILNPMAENSDEYLRRIDEYIESLVNIDIVAVCAGFDSYILDVGHKLSTFDFYVIGRKMKQLSKRLCKGRRFAVLEGGYYLPDLGKNVVSFCDGFKDGVF